MRLWRGGAVGAVLATAAGLLLSVSAPAAPPGLVVEGSSVEIGGTIHATAKLSESPGAGGEISFEVFGPGDPTCLGPALAQSSATVAGEGDYLSDDFEPTLAGSYHWTASYSGDEANEPAESVCSGISTVTKAAPGLTGNASSATVGGAIHDTVTLTGGSSPGGEVTFRVYAPGDTSCATPLETSIAPIASANAISDDFLTQQAGEFRWTASYPGDANNAGASLPCGAANQASVVAKASPGLSGTATSTVVVGGAITDQATLSGGFEPSGQIVFRAFGPGDGSCGTTPAYEATVPVDGNGPYSPPGFSPAPGLYRWTASYEGDGNNQTVSLACNASGQNSTVTKATPGLTGNASSATVGSAIHDTVTLMGGSSPGGEVTFRVYAPGDTTCATPLDTSAAPIAGGVATSDDFLSQQAGEFRWTASYAGDTNNEPFSLPCGASNQSSVVAKASPGLSGTATSTVVVSGTITHEATLSGGFEPGGQIVFRAFGPGDGSCGTTPAYEATVLVNGNGSYSPAGFSPAPGLYRWTASYEGDGNNQVVGLGCNASGQSSTVTKATPGMTGNASSSTVGAAIHDTVTLTGSFSPSGEVTFRVYAPGDTTCVLPLATTTAPIASGVATSDDFITQQAGEFRWTASYPGDANNAGASLPCGAANQTSVVAKASPGLSGTATSTVVVGGTITDQATLSGGFTPAGQIVFRAFGPGDASCGGTPAYEATILVNGNGSYSPPGFSPAPGLYRWTVQYLGDSDNQTVGLPCNASGQSSAVGIVNPALAASAEGATIGNPVAATAVLKEGAIPGGQIVFKAFPPADTNCSGAVVFSSTVEVAGNGTYRSDAFEPNRVGTFRWTVAYSGDTNHAPAAVACGIAASAISQAKPSISGAVPQQTTVGTPFSDAVTLRGGFVPNGTVTFRIYGPTAGGCAGPAFVNIVAIKGNGTVNSDPFVALRTGRYSFTASYSGDSENQAASEPCDSPSQVVQVLKRSPRVKPRAVLIGTRQISIRAHLAGSVSPSGSITFRLFGPSDRKCRRKPKFSGGVTVKSNGTFSLARYLATKPGVYRLSVAYTGDARNRRAKTACGDAQPIRVK